MLNLENIDFEAKKLAAMVRMRIHCFDIPKMYRRSKLSKVYVNIIYMIHIIWNNNIFRQQWKPTPDSKQILKAQMENSVMVSKIQGFFYYGNFHSVTWNF